MAQPQSHPSVEELAQQARRDTKRVLSSVRAAVRSLAQLEEGLRAHGIDGISVTTQDNGKE